MTELLLIRHGETDWNRELRFQGQVDVPLNAVGHEQARRVAQRLAGVSAHHLYVSDLIRTRQTAEPVLQALPLDHAADATLREQNFGLVDGMRVEDIKAQHPAAWASWIQFQEDFAFGGGESTRQFHTRVMDTVRRLAAAHAGQTLVVVTHGGVLDMIYRAALALPLSGPRQCEIPNAGLNHVQVAGDGLKIVSWADTRHLADLPPQPTYDQARLAALAKLSVSPSAA